MKEIKSNSEAPIFIFAASWRTGSTLLQRVLNASGCVFIYGEPGFISNLRFLYNQNKDYLEKVSWNRERNSLDKQGQWIPIFNPPVDNLTHATRCYFETLYNLKSIGIEDNRRWGFKEVRDNTYEDSKFLKEIYPNAKFLYLIRNPFDMYISLKGQEAIFNNFKDDKPFYPVEVWNRNVSFFLDQNKLKEVNGMVVNYEQMINPSKSENVLKSLAEYLGISYCKDMLNELTMKAGGTQTKNPLSDKEIEHINKIIEKNNEQLAYSYDEEVVE